MMSKKNSKKSPSKGSKPLFKSFRAPDNLISAENCIIRGPDFDAWRQAVIGTLYWKDQPNLKWKTEGLDLLVVSESPGVAQAETGPASLSRTTTGSPASLSLNSLAITKISSSSGRVDGETSAQVTGPVLLATDVPSHSQTKSLSMSPQYRLSSRRHSVSYESSELLRAGGRRNQVTALLVDPTLIPISPSTSFEEMNKRGLPTTPNITTAKHQLSSPDFPEPPKRSKILLPPVVKQPDTRVQENPAQDKLATPVRSPTRIETFLTLAKSIKTPPIQGLRNNRESLTDVKNIGNVTEGVPGLSLGLPSKKRFKVTTSRSIYYRNFLSPTTSNFQDLMPLNQPDPIMHSALIANADLNVVLSGDGVYVVPKATPNTPTLIRRTRSSKEPATEFEEYPVLGVGGDRKEGLIVGGCILESLKDLRLVIITNGPESQMSIVTLDDDFTHFVRRMEVKHHQPLDHGPLSVCALGGADTSSRFATVDAYKKLFIWKDDGKAVNLQEAAQLTRPSFIPTSVAYQKDNNGIYVGGAGDGTGLSGGIEHWDINGGQARYLNTIKTDAPVSQIHMVSSDVIIAETTSTSLQFALCDFRDPLPPLRFGYAGATSGSWKGDFWENQFIRGGPRGTVLVWDIRHLDDGYDPLSISDQHDVTNVLFDRQANHPKPHLCALLSSGCLELTSLLSS